MKKSETKKNPTSSPAKTIDAGLQVDTPKRSGASVPAFEITEPMAHALGILVKRTGLSEDAVLRHLLASGLHWAGRYNGGWSSFNLLLDASLGEARAEEAKEQGLERCYPWGMNCDQFASDLDLDEAEGRFPGDWPAAEKAEV